MSDNGVTFRPAIESDVPRMVQLIAGAALPPLFIVEHLEGFIVGEREGAVIACGGLEMYEDCGFIRSVVVDEAGRGLGLGRIIAEMLEVEAWRRGAVGIYLFTADALPFWQHLGYDEISVDDWRRPARLCWQYQFITQNADLFEGQPPPHTMWRAA